MRNVTRNIPVPASVASGAAVDVSDLDPAKLQLSVGGTFDATVQFEGTLDGTNWFSLGAAIQDVKGTVGVATDGTAKMQAVNKVRATVTEWTSGQPNAVAVGAKQLKP